MTELTVIDPGLEDIAGKIAARLRDCQGKTGELLIRKASSLGDLSGLRPDVMVLSPDTVQYQPNVLGQVTCGILLLPGDLPRDTVVEGYDAGCIVTYGMSPKNTITLSSIGEESCVLAIQRELTTAQGDVLERQEIPVTGGMRPVSLLAVTGGLLVAGVKLPKINP